MRESADGLLEAFGSSHGHRAVAVASCARRSGLGRRRGLERVRATGRAERAVAAATPVASPSVTPAPFAGSSGMQPPPRWSDARTGFDAVVLGDGTVLAVGDDRACIPGRPEPGSETGRALRPDRRRLGRGPEPEQATQGAGDGRPMSDGSALVIGGLNDVGAAVLEHEAVRRRTPGRGRTVR